MLSAHPWRLAEVPMWWEDPQPWASPHTHRILKIGPGGLKSAHFISGHFGHLQCKCPMMDCSFGHVWTGESQAHKQPAGNMTILLDMEELWAVVS